MFILVIYIYKDTTLFINFYLCMFSYSIISLNAIFLSNLEVHFIHRFIVYNGCKL